MYNELPKGMTEFESYAAEIIKESGLPDNDSTRWALGIAVMHTPAPNLKDFTSVADYLTATLQKGAFNQIAAQVVNDLKAKQEAETAKRNAEKENNVQETEQTQKSH